VPRLGARAVESIGPFTLFHRPPSRPSYARPSLGSRSFSADDVARVARRQQALGLPEAYEWVKETSPSLAAALNGAGFEVSEHPLMLLDEPVHVSAQDVGVRLTGEDDDPALVGALAEVAFGSPGTAIGPHGVEEMLARAAEKARDPVAEGFERAERRAGRSVWAVAFVDNHLVGAGGHQPLEGVTEIVGVGVLPAFRRRGIGAALTAVLAHDALARGLQTVFLSAGDETIGRVYERVGFRRVATACIAEPRRSR
jgi:ribosomal protein S18 acetylase RimI-like enzyme